MKFRTDFVTNSSSSSFVAVSITTKDGKIINGQSKMGSGYHEIPIISGEKDDEALIKEVIDNSKNGIEFCDAIYKKLLFDIHSIHDDFYRIRDIEDFSNIAEIHIKAIQEGTNGGGIDYVYNFESGNAIIEYPKVKWDYYDEFHSEILAKYFDGVENFNQDGDFEIKNGVLIKYNGDSQKITVPDGVIGIGANAFYCKYQAKEIILPNTIKFIDCNAFADCSKLEKINLPEGIQCIGAKAFSRCDSIEKLELPSSVIELGYKCFYQMEILTEIKIPPYVSVIKGSLFAECRQLKKIELPNSLTEICADAFSSCKSLKEINVPEGVKKLGDSAFWDCKRLERIYLPSTLKELYAGQLCYTPNLKSIEIDENNPCLKSVDGAIYTSDMRMLIKCLTCKKEFTVNENTVYIGDYAFTDNTTVEKVILPTKLKTIGIEAFVSCSSLKEIDLPSSLVSLGDCAFRNCSSLEKAYIPKELDIDPHDHFDMWKDNFEVIKK